MGIGASDSVNSDFDTDTAWLANYQYYFSAVSQEKGPYALNNWLAQSSILGLNLTSNGDTRSYGVNGQYVTESKWFIGANYSITDLDTPNNPSIDRYSADLGYYFDEWTSISLVYGKVEFNDLFGNPETTGYGISATRYIPLKGESGFLVSGFFDRSESNYFGDKKSRNYFHISSDYYFNKSWSFGLNYSRDDDDDAYSVNTNYFWRISNYISLITNINKAIEPDNGNGIGIGLNLTARF